MESTVSLLLGVLSILGRAQARIGFIQADAQGSAVAPTTAGQAYCFAYNPSFKKLPTSYSGQPSQLVANFTHRYGCNNTFGDLLGEVVAVARGNCTFVQKAANIQKGGGEAALIVDFDDEASFAEPGASNSSSDYNTINITVAIMHHKDFAALLAGGSEVKVWLYAPENKRRFNPSVLLLFGLASVCVAIGALWSGKVQAGRQKTKGRGSGRRKERDGEGEEKSDQDDLTMSVGMGVAMSVGLVVIFCVSLTLLYYFYDYLVYAIIGVFCVAGVNAMFKVILPMWKKLVPFDRRLLGPKSPQLRSLVLLLPVTGFVVTWLVLRHESYAWVLQDVIGFCFCIYIMKVIVMPSFKACTVLLGLLFFYDIFFVFITPYFTKDGESVMVKVATGGDSKSRELMPTVFVLPHIVGGTLAQCLGDQGSLLGYGDVIVPGLLISYNCAFDLKTRNLATGRWSYLYFTATCVAYVVGLLLTGLALFMMESGQPALLYLVPCTLLTTISIAAARREVTYIWRGHECPKKNDDIQRNSSVTPEAVPRSSLSQEDCNINAEHDEEEEEPSENQSLIQ